VQVLVLPKVFLLDSEKVISGEILDESGEHIKISSLHGHYKIDKIRIIRIFKDKSSFFYFSRRKRSMPAIGSWRIIA
jgi:hypothetical protein